MMDIFRVGVTMSVKIYPTTPAAICRRRMAARIPRNYRNIQLVTTFIKT